MRRQSVLRLGIALGLLAMGTGVVRTVSAQPSARPAQSKIIVFKSQVETETHIGIMGQVARPGTYRFAHPPTLQLAVDSTGGILDAASPMIRVVRGQRVVQRIAAHAGANDVLQTGDLVIVDSLPQRTDAAEPKSAEGVQLAFLGVQNHPVIVNVRAAEARADLVAQMLGQSPQVLRTLKIIPPPPAHGAAKINTTPMLADGTVLLFDRQMIAESELRNLPEIIPCSLPEPETLDMGGYGVRNAYEERRGENGPAAARSNTAPPWQPTPGTGALSQVPPPTVESPSDRTPTLLPDYRTPATLSSTGNPGAMSAPVTTLPFSGTAAISARATRSTELPPLDPPPLAADAQSPNWDIDRAAESAARNAATTDDIDADFDDGQTSGQSLSAWHMVSVVALSALLVGAALAIRSLPAFQATSKSSAHHSRRYNLAARGGSERRMADAITPPPTPHLPISSFSAANPAEPAARSDAAEGFEIRQQRFQQLIQKELSLVEEPLALRPGLMWSANETGDIRPKSPKLTASRAAPEIPAPPAAAPIRQIDPPHPQRTSGPHQRIGNESPVERALRQLQGGNS